MQLEDLRGEVSERQCREERAQAELGDAILRLEGSLGVGEELNEGVEHSLEELQRMVEHKASSLPFMSLYLRGCGLGLERSRGGSPDIRSPAFTDPM